MEEHYIANFKSQLYDSVLVCERLPLPARELRGSSNELTRGTRRGGHCGSPRLPTAAARVGRPQGPQGFDKAARPLPDERARDLGLPGRPAVPRRRRQLPRGACSACRAAVLPPPPPPPSATPAPGLRRNLRRVAAAAGKPAGAARRGACQRRMQAWVCGNGGWGSQAVQRAEGSAG